jgi:hypothetical protein
VVKNPLPEEPRALHGRPGCVYAANRADRTIALRRRVRSAVAG